MDWLQLILMALDTGADRVLDAAVVYAGLWLTYGLMFAKKSALARVPVMFQAVVAGLIEAYLEPIARNGVRYAEEWAQKQIDKGLAAAGTLGRAKMAAAKQYVLSKTWTDWLISDEQLEKLIESQLVAIGRGASGAITITTDAAVREIEAAPGPPAS